MQTLSGTVDPCATAVRYDVLDLGVDATGPLVGSGSGQIEINNFGARTITPVTMSLAGVEDTVPPTLPWVSGADMTDPFIPLEVAASEPLPVRALVVRGTGGDVFELSPDSDTFFVMEPQVLRQFGEQYSVDISGVRDFAGNAAVTSEPDGLALTTVPPPPLVLPDGFESVTDATLGGAQVLSAPGDPVINGTRSLYVPVAAPGTTIGFALRIAVPPGATTIQFAYRSVTTDGHFGWNLDVASVGGPLLGADLGPDNGATTPAMLGGMQVLLGPVTMERIPLPAGASNEVVIHHVAQAVGNECEGIAPTPLPGLILDDLSVE